MLRDVSMDSADTFRPRFRVRCSIDEVLPRHAWSASNATSNPEDNHAATGNPEDNPIFTELAGDKYAGNFVRGVSSLRRLRMARRANAVAPVQVAEPTVPRHGPSGPHRSQHHIAITDPTNAATFPLECQDADAMISDEMNDGVSEPHEKSLDGDRRPRQPSGRCDGRPHRSTFKFVRPLRKPSQERSHHRQQPSNMQPSQEPAASNMACVVVCEPELDILGNMQPSQEHAASTTACAAAPAPELAGYGPDLKRATRNMSNVAVRGPELAGYGNMEPPQKRATSDMACAAGFCEPLQERMGSFVACAKARTPELVGLGNM